MNSRLIVLSSALLLAGTAAVQSAPATATITVFPDRYVYEGRIYDDLHRLEDAVRAPRPGAVVLHSCGPRETRVLVAAAHRFRDLPARVRFLNRSGDGECSPLVFAPASLRTTDGPTGIDDRAITEYWSVFWP